MAEMWFKKYIVSQMLIIKVLNSNITSFVMNSVCVYRVLSFYFFKEQDEVVIRSKPRIDNLRVKVITN